MTPEQKALREAVARALETWARDGFYKQADAAIAVALERAAKMAKTAWLTTPYGSIADADAMCGMCEDLSDAIRALIKEK